MLFYCCFRRERKRQPQEKKSTWKPTASPVSCSSTHPPPSRLAVLGETSASLTARCIDFQPRCCCAVHGGRCCGAALTFIKVCRCCMWVQEQERHPHWYITLTWRNKMRAATCIEWTTLYPSLMCTNLHPDRHTNPSGKLKRHNFSNETNTEILSFKLWDRQIVFNL